MNAVHPETQARRHASLSAALAPLLPFLQDDTVIEIMLNADGAIWIDRMGEGLVRTSVDLASADAFRMLKLVATEMNTEITDRSPSLSGKLPIWGARVQAAIPPVVDAPVFALRKPPKVIFSLQDYVTSGVMSAAQADILRTAVLSHQNIIVGGGTGSGKTTLANALLQVVATTTDRVYLVEDNPELQCAAPNKVQVLVQPPSYTWQRAIMDAMRLRPDRIIVGEVRDGAALQMLKAWNTGHPGGIATIHANDTRAMLERTCQLIEEVVPRAPRHLVAETVNLCVHLRRDRTRHAGRSVTGIDRVVGVDSTGAWLMECARATTMITLVTPRL